MQTAIQARNALNAAGFNLSLCRSLLSADVESSGPSSSGFVTVKTGSGWMALRRDIYNFYILITSDDGSDVPDKEDWSRNLIGVYRDSIGEGIACFTTMDWQ